MKKGTNINGYAIASDFKLSGLSKWAFARKDGKRYFIKQFLSPVYPDDSAGGSASIKAKKRAACEQFEQRQMRLIKAVDERVSAGGNLVFTKDFFRHGSKYYKVTDRVNVSPIVFADVAKLPLEQQLLMLKTITASVRVLHMAGIVHGDLKPDNILIKSTDRGDYIAKLIDFDDSYFSGEPPENPDSMVGDLTYYSPEVEYYIMGHPAARAEQLQTSSDIFSLGLIFCQYLTGKLPNGIKKGQTASQAVNLGTTIKMHDKAGKYPPRLTRLVNSMLEAVPKARPVIGEVFDSLKNATKPDMAEPTEAPPLKINMKKKKLGGSEVEKPPPPTSAPRVKINMRKKK